MSDPNGVTILETFPRGPLPRPVFERVRDHPDVNAAIVNYAIGPNDLDADVAQLVTLLESGLAVAAHLDPDELEWRLIASRRVDLSDRDDRRRVLEELGEQLVDERGDDDAYGRALTDREVDA